jgi:hypothetical protein
MRNEDLPQLRQVTTRRATPGGIGDYGEVLTSPQRRVVATPGLAVAERVREVDALRQGEEQPAACEWLQVALPLCSSHELDQIGLARRARLVNDPSCGGKGGEGSAQVNPGGLEMAGLADINHWELTGRMARDAEVQESNGRKRLRLRVAVHE